MADLRDEDVRPFLRAIHDRPGDELPHLIFADSLDEHGDWRGPLLRRPKGNPARWDETMVRAWQQWLGDLPPSVTLTNQKGLLGVALDYHDGDFPAMPRLRQALRQGWVRHM